MPQSAQFITQTNPSVEQKLSSPFPCKPSGCGGSVKLTEKLSFNLIYRDISISATAYVADSQLNLRDLNWFGQLGLLNLSINAIYSRMHSTTSTIPFTTEMTIQRFPEIFKEGPGHVIVLRRH
ncbi:hypothetical protein ACTXT7_006902 [Hymenolepis weldensis]